MMPSYSSLIIAAGMAVVVAATSYRLRCATGDGAVTLGAIVAIIMGLGGWPWAAVALAYVALLLGASCYRREQKTILSEAVRRKGRLGWQKALSRLGWAIVLVAIRPAAPAYASYAALVGCVAASAADLAGTQMGLLNAQPPRLIVNWQRAAPGSPGAVSPLGLLAAVGAAWTIGLTGLAAQSIQSWLDEVTVAAPWTWLPSAALAGGMAGALVDSLLAATAQPLYYDPSSEKLTEFERGADGLPNERVRGWTWLTDETIDLVASVVGAAVTCALVAWLAHSMRQW